MYSGLNVDFMPANTKSILQPINQKVTLIFNSQYLKSTFHKAIAAIDCNSSERTRKNKLKDFWTEFTNLDAICNVCDSCICAESLQFCSTLCEPVDCSPSGCSLHGILEARILEWDWNGLHALLQGIFMTQDWTQVSRVSCIGQVGSLPTEPPGNGKRQKYWQELRSWFQPSWMTLKFSKTSVKEITADVETARELELEVEPEDVATI